MDISGSIVFNINSQPSQLSGNQPIKNIPVALQVEGTKTVIGTFEGKGIVVKTDSSGKFKFTSVPQGKYRVVEAASYMGTISTSGDWGNAQKIIVTPADPAIATITSPPSEANRVNSLSPNTVYV